VVRQTKTDLFAVGTAAGTSVHLAFPHADKTLCGRPAVRAHALGWLEFNGCVRCRRSALDQGYTHAIENLTDKVQIPPPP
jgi:hypothetical protein